MNTLIIDADSILHVAGMQEDTDSAIHYFEEKVFFLTNFLYENEDFEAENTFIVVGGTGNFRKFICPSYKENRKEKPKFFNFIKAWAIQNMGAISSNLVEADDVIAALCKREKLLGNTVVLASLDKDLKAISGIHFFDMYHTRMTLSQSVSDIDALRQHYTLMLVGDASDNIKVKNGIGKIKAEKLLSDKTTEFGMRKATWQVYRNVFKHKAREKYIITKSLITLQDDESLIPEIF